MANEPKRTDEPVEAEVSPEMIDAGIEAYYAADEWLTTEEERFAIVYRAMSAVKTKERVPVPAAHT